jgi:4'-phosphopantetheinyl transferase
MSGDGIDLWQFPLDGGPEEVNAALAVLGPGERAHFRQFANSRLAAAFAIRRAARRIILAGYLGIEPSEVKTCDAPSGKPGLPGPSPGLYFNASHSKDLGILAVASRFPVGADVERLRPIDTKALAARILSPSECLEFNNAEPDARNAGMFRVWTEKEALVKGIGVGLDLRDLPLISAPIIPAPAPASAVWRPAEFGGRMKVHGRWYVYSLVPSEGYVISLAAPAEAAVTVLDARGLLAGQGI